MTHTTRLALCTLALSLLVGCAPSERSLLRRGHYDDALAGVQLAALDGPTVLPAVAEALEVGLHVQALSPEQLRAALPGAPQGFEDVALVRIIHASHDVSLQRYAVDVSLQRVGVDVLPVDDTIVALAKRSGEPLPEPKRVYDPGRAGSTRLVQTTRFPLAELLFRGLFNISTLGLAHDAVPLVESTGTPPGTYLVEPTLEDYARATPAAAALSTWVRDDVWVEPGKRVTSWQLWTREGEGPASLHVEVELDALYTLRCDIPLPAGELEAGFATVFGQRERQLVELCTPELEYAIGVEFDDDEITAKMRRRLAQRVRAWLAQPGLHIEVSCERDEPSLRRAEHLRAALVGLGVPEAQVQVEPSAAVAFRPRLIIRHRLPPSPH